MNPEMELTKFSKMLTERAVKQMIRRTYLPKNWELPVTIMNRLGPEAGRQRLMDEEGHLLLILHAVPKASDEERRQPVLFWRNPEGQWKSSPQAGGLAALEEHLKTYTEVIHQLDADIEAAVCPEQYFIAMQEIQPVMRSTRHLMKVLQAAREARREEAPLIELRDRAGDLDRAIELVAGDAKAGMDFTLARAAQEQAAVGIRNNLEARRLNRLVAFFFPLATLVSFFSMSNAGEVLSSALSWAVVAVGILFGVIVLIAVTQGKNS